MTSPLSQMPFAAYWIDIAWNGKVFCALGAQGELAISPNGVSWTPIDPLPQYSWNRIYSNGSIFCAVAGNGTETHGRWAASFDGKSWVSGAMPVNARWRDLVWNGSVFCAISGNTLSSTNTSAISTDGQNWTQGDDIELASSVCWNGSVFSTLSPINDWISISTNGTTWTSHQTAPGYIGARTIYNGDILCSVGTSGKVGVSTNGINWTVNSLPAASSTYYGLSWNGTVFCATSRDGYSNAVSTDGEVWTQYNPMPAYGYWDSVAWNGSVFCALDSNNSVNVATSPDGKWNTYELPERNFWVKNKGHSELIY